MALWKKVLIWLAVAFGILLIVFFLFYYTLSNINFASIETGRYELYRISRTENGETTVLEEYETSELYLDITDEGDITSHSGEVGVKEREGGYNYFLHGEELLIFLPTDEGEIAYTGIYREGKISISIDSENFTTHYFYRKTA